MKLHDLHQFEVQTYIYNFGISNIYHLCLIYMIHFIYLINKNIEHALATAHSS